MRKPSESGYALLLVFAMAASVAIMLYKELPRLVFESQRIKEQELIDRGEEYQRAIQLYVRKFNRYPAAIGDLETADNIRFLRRRYKDPMTGEEEWRLIHIDATGAYTDSLIHERPSQQEEEESVNTFITEGAAFGSTLPAPGDAQGQTGADVRGASDRPAISATEGQLGGIPGAPPSPYGGQQQFPGQTPYQPQSPGQTMPGFMPGQAGANPQQPSYPQPGMVPSQPYPFPQQPQQGAQQPNPNMPVGLAPFLIPGQVNPQQIGQQQSPAFRPNPNAVPGIGPNVMPGQSPAQQQNPGFPQQIPGLPGPYGMPQQTSAPSQPGGSPAPFGPGQGTNPAIKVIQDIITSPRPGSFPGQQTGSGSQGETIGGGIAGVASKMEADSIMSYNERSKYHEWEFLYDYSREQASRAAAGGAGTGTGAMGSAAAPGAGNTQSGNDSQKNNRNQPGSFPGIDPPSFGSPGQNQPFSPFPGQPPTPPFGRGR